MTSKEIHKLHIKEHIQEIEDAIAIGIENRASTIGLHVSACSIELLELYLHIIGKIPSGFILKHEWFKAPKPNQKVEPLADRKIGINFDLKEEIFSMIYPIEEERNKLIYGKPSKLIAESVLKEFQKLYALIKNKLHEKGEEIE